jgi:hypothetical protein
MRRMAALFLGNASGRFGRDQSVEAALPFCRRE